jgi:Zn-dependent protease with chaperone function
MKFKSLCAASVVLLSGSVMASPPVLAQPAGYAPMCGIQVFLAPNPQGASATVLNGLPVIVVDYSQLSNQVWMQFVLAHECGHHMSGHVTPQGYWFRTTQYWATSAQELEADCWAARVAGPQVAAFAAQYFEYSQGHHSGAPGYPSGVQRAQAIRQCGGVW